MSRRVLAHFFSLFRATIEAVAGRSLVGKKQKLQVVSTRKAGKTSPHIDWHAAITGHRHYHVDCRLPWVGVITPRAEAATEAAAESGRSSLQRDIDRMGVACNTVGPINSPELTSPIALEGETAKKRDCAVTRLRCADAARIVQRSSRSCCNLYAHRFVWSTVREEMYQVRFRLETLDVEHRLNVYIYFIYIYTAHHGRFSIGTEFIIGNVT